MWQKSVISYNLGHVHYNSKVYYRGSGNELPWRGGQRHDGFLTLSEETFSMIF